MLLEVTELCSYRGDINILMFLFRSFHVLCGRWVEAVRSTWMYIDNYRSDVIARGIMINDVKEGSGNQTEEHESYSNTYVYMYIYFYIKYSYSNILEYILI